MKLALLLGLLAAATPQEPADPARDTSESRIQGVIRFLEDGRRTPVPYAMVEVAGPGVRRVAMAGPAGAYALDRIPAGRHRLRTLHAGYETIEVEILVPPAETVEVDLVLQTRAVPLPALRVTAARPSLTDTDPDEAPRHTAGAGLVDLRALEASPGLVESGLGDAVRSLPGNEPQDPTDVLLMRGSTTDLKLVLLDGAPVYAPFHTGGLLQAFQVSSLGAAAHHVGGAPARYDGGLSYILDLRTRPARRNRMRTSGSIDLMSLQGAVEAPLGRRAGVLAAGRTLHDAGGRLAGGSGSPYGYSDVLLRGDLDVGAEGRVSVTGFTNHEAVHLDLPASGTSPGLDAASWGNHVISASWRTPVGRGADLDLGVATTSYHAELPVTLPSGSSQEDGGTSSSVHVASGTTERTLISADLRLPAEAGGLRVGATLDRTEVAYGTRSAGISPTTARSHGSLLGAYVDGLHTLSDEFDLRYGMRLDRFEPGGVKVAPRLAVLWSLGPDALLTVAGGRYHQLVRLGDTEADLAMGDALEVGTVSEAGAVASGLLRTATADHLTLSLDQGVTPQVRLAFDGYLKRFRNLGPTSAPELASSGADLRVLRQGEATTAWLGYSLAWFWDTGATPVEFSGRHLLSAGLRGLVLGPVGIDFRASFSDGLPLTAVAVDESHRPATRDESGLEDGPLPGVNTGRVDGFLRIDAEVFAQWTREWGSRTMRIRPYLKVLNALDRRDALFYYFEPWRGDELRPLAELSLVPIAGVEWRF